jgi:hypothetical protein
MKQHSAIVKGQEFLFQYVPDDSQDYRMSPCGTRLTWTNYTGRVFSSDSPDTPDLPPGEWEIVGPASSLTEEQAAGIARQYNRADLNLRSYRPTPFVNYLKPWSYFAGDDGPYLWCALDSLRSLLESLSFDPSRTIILRKS